MEALLLLIDGLIVAAAVLMSLMDERRGPRKAPIDIFAATVSVPSAAATKPGGQNWRSRRAAPAPAPAPAAAPSASGSQDTTMGRTTSSRHPESTGRRARTV